MTDEQNGIIHIHIRFLDGEQMALRTTQEALDHWTATKIIVSKNLCIPFTAIQRIEVER